MTEPTGLLCMQARFYSPILKRFLSEDPAGLEGGLNLYAFAAGDPVNAMDPFGLGPVNTKTFTNWTGLDSLGVAKDPAWFKQLNNRSCGVAAMMNADLHLNNGTSTIPFKTFQELSKNVGAGMVTGEVATMFNKHSKSGYKASIEQAAKPVAKEDWSNGVEFVDSLIARNVSFISLDVFEENSFVPHFRYNIPATGGLRVIDSLRVHKFLIDDSVTKASEMIPATDSLLEAVIFTRNNQ